MPLPTNQSQPNSEPIPLSDSEISEELKVLYPRKTRTFITCNLDFTISEPDEVIVD